MNILMIVLRVIHIFAGIFWVGFGIFNVFYLQPAVAATGADGQKVMGHLARNTNLLAASYTAATLVALSGLTMYGILSGFRAAFLTTGYGLALGLGGLAGIVAWGVVMVTIRGIFTQMAAIGRQVASQGGPPTPEQGAALKALSGRLAVVGRWNLGILLVSVLGMAIAQYV